jgi:hypothetical protein
MLASAKKSVRLYSDDGRRVEMYQTSGDISVPLCLVNAKFTQGLDMAQKRPDGNETKYKDDNEISRPLPVLLCQILVLFR